MAATTLPRQRQSGRGRWIAGGIAVIVIAILLALTLFRPAAPPGSVADTTPVVRGDIVGAVDSTGTLAADQSVELSFPVSGTVVEVLVDEGDVVSAGQPLARLDDRELALSVASAEASLESARAQLAQRQTGNATPEQIAAAEASVASAEAQLTQTRTGNVTAADIADAEAQLRSAQAQLDELLAGPGSEELAAAQASYDQAVANLESQRASLSAAKTRAESELAQTANSLRDAQDDYSRIYWDNRELEKAPGELSQERKDEEAAALRAVASAEESLRQAEVALEEAREAERTGIASAEAQLRDAEEQLRATRAGASQAEITQAQASVDQARANLQKLRQGGTAAEVAAAQASVDQARANLAELTAPATATDLRIQEASVAQAEQSLAQARLQLEQATLVAPFSAIVSSVAIVPGSVVGSGSLAITLIDRDPLHVDLRLSENDVARVALNQRVELTIDALPDSQLQGVVSYIAPAAETENGVVTYGVRVAINDAPEAVKVGMTANLRIIYAEKQAVLLVPASALLPRGDGRVVQVPASDPRGEPQEIAVETGLSDGNYTEILSGLSEGQQIIATPGQSRQGPGGLFGQ
ncbi:MAG: efflux RND transporter periplasmic adaptor subunit [Chloroflexi bacterium OHK40]